MTTSIFAIIATLISAFFGGIGVLFLKKSSDKIRLNFWKLIKNYYLIYGIISYGLAIIIFIPALKFGELSILYPIASFTYIWAILFSIYFLNEKMNKFKWLGIILIIIGVTFLGFGS